MRKATIFAAVVLMLVCMLAPSVRFTEDNDTVLLARTIYALGKAESYETKLALGTVVMNRVENAWFDSSLGEVLTEQHQFPAGSRYDSDSLKAAHAVLSGERALSEKALYYQPLDAQARWSDENLVQIVGGYAFYSATENI